MSAFKFDFENNQKATKKPAPPLPDPLPDGMDLLFYAFKQMSSRHPPPGPNDTAVLNIRRWCASIVNWQRTHDSMNHFIAGVLSDNFPERTDTHNWAYLITRPHDSDISHRMNLNMINSALKTQFQKAAAQPQRIFAFDAILTAIQAGRVLAPVVENPAYLRDDALQDIAFKTLKDIGDCIELLSTEIMGLNPKIATALKSEILKKNPISEEKFEKYFDIHGEINMYSVENFSSHLRYYEWLKTAPKKR